jgi:hypothetical protein
MQLVLVGCFEAQGDEECVEVHEGKAGKDIMFLLRHLKEKGG